MLSGISTASAEPVRFTVIHQFANDRSARQLADTTGFDVEWISLKLSPLEGLRLIVYLALGRFLGARFLLGEVGKATVDTYRRADVVVSAPGGPYFGDLYIGHEPVHWLYVWMARMFAKPSLLYATSAGPFAKRLANPFRRFTYRTFDRLWVREEISAEHIRTLFGPKQSVAVDVSIDAALQVSIPPLQRNDARRLVVVSAIDRPYGGDPDPLKRRENYDASVAAAVATICGGVSTDVVLVPQLHDSVHRDTPYLERLATRIGALVVSTDVDVSVFDEARDMLAQRALFASADFVVAGRYHPAVFALSAGVAQLCIPYEHKATGVLQSAGLADLVVPLDEVTPERLAATARYVVNNADDIRRRSRDAAVRLSEISSRTSRSVVELMNGAR